MPLEPPRFNIGNVGALAMCSKIRLLIASAILIASLTPTNQARAEIITFEFAGVVTGVDFSLDGQLALGDIDLPAIGTPFTGYYKFDSTAVDTISSPLRGGYSTILTENAVEVSIGEFRLEGQGW